MTAGTLITVIAGALNSFPIMLIGRILNNVGSEVLAGAVNALLTKWFSEGELVKVSSIGLFCGGFAAMSSGWIYPPLYSETYNLFLPLMVGLIVCLYSCICTVIALYLDY